MAFEVRKLNKSFGIGGGRHRVVRNFSMKVQDNEMVAVVGKKGSGKSTLMSILGGLLRPDSGTVTVDGHRIYYWNPIQRAILRTKRVGIVPRDALLISDMTIYENLLLPMGHKFMTGKRKMRRAKEVLRAVGLKGFGKYYPADLEDFELQKVCLARAIMTKPKYLILDEPTGNLQSADVDRFMDIVEILRSSGFTIIVLTHSRRVASHCERLIPITPPRSSQPDPDEDEEEEDEDENEDDEDEEESEEPEEEEEEDEEDEEAARAKKYEQGADSEDEDE